MLAALAENPKRLVTCLTLFRVVAIVPITLLFMMDFEFTAWLGLFLYIIAALSDMADGWAARHYDVTSEAGDMLDTIADKIFVSSMLILAMAVGNLYGLWAICVIVIIAREFTIGALREYLRSNNIPMPHSQMGRVKTFIQMAALGFVLIGSAGDALIPFSLEIGHAALLVATLLTCISGWAYLKKAWPHLKPDLE